MELKEITHAIEIVDVGGAWLAQLEEQATLNLGVMRLSLTLGTEIT